MRDNGCGSLIIFCSFNSKRFTIHTPSLLGCILPLVISFNSSCSVACSWSESSRKRIENLYNEINEGQVRFLYRQNLSIQEAAARLSSAVSRAAHP